MVTKWGIRHQWHVPVPTTDSVKQTLTIFWAPIFSRGLKICNSNLPGEDLWERKQKEIHCILSASVMLSLSCKKQKAELQGTAFSSLKQNQTYNILKIPLPLILNISHAQLRVE